MSMKTTPRWIRAAGIAFSAAVAVAVATVTVSAAAAEPADTDLDLDQGVASQYWQSGTAIEMQYQFSVHNEGPDDISGFLVTVDTSRSSTIRIMEGNGGTVCRAATCARTFAGSFDEGEDRTFTLRVAAQFGTEWTLEVQPVGGEDQNQRDNVAEGVLPTLTTGADLAVRQTAAAMSSLVRNRININYTFTVNNDDGQVAAPSWTIRVNTVGVLSMKITDHTGAQAKCLQEIVCTLTVGDGLPVDGRREFTVRFNGPVGTRYIIEVQPGTSGGVFESDHSDNRFDSTLAAV